MFLPFSQQEHGVLCFLLQGELGYPSEALEPLQVAEAIPPLPRPALPPYNGYGTLDDSKQNCVALVPKPPKKVCAKHEQGSAVHTTFAIDVAHVARACHAMYQWYCTSGRDAALTGLLSLLVYSTLFNGPHCTVLDACRTCTS